MPSHHNSEKTEQKPGHLAKWWKNAFLGESDLSHCDKLMFVGRDEWTPDIIKKAEGDDANRYAACITGQYRHGNDMEFIHPIRRLEWNMGCGESFIAENVIKDESPHFRFEKAGSPTYRIDGTLCGLLNLRGEVEEYIDYNAIPYSHEAYLSCWVLLPNDLSFAESEVIPAGEQAETPQEKERVHAPVCFDGVWRTSLENGYSCSLTHAFGAALRRKIADWPFFAVTPVFLTKERENSAGYASVWLIEPANSGLVVQPLLRRLLKDPKFRQDLYQEALETLQTCQTLEELRMVSHMAFADEVFTEDDRQKAISLFDHIYAKDKQIVRKLKDSYTPGEREFDKAVVGALMSFEESIDVTKFVNKYNWNSDKILDLFMDVLWNNPQVFFISKRGEFQQWDCEDGQRCIITKLMYGLSKDEYSKCKKELDRAIAEALRYIDGIVDPVEKAQILHDYIIRNCEYDEEAANKNDSSPLARTVYSVLVRRKAVCEGYTMAYRYLLREAGIRSEEVISNEMKHCWNYVQIGDNWYHVDVTHDDPIADGKDPKTYPILHNFFLKSDEAIKSQEHKNWDVRDLPAATDTTYDNREWKVIESLQ